MYSQVFNNQVRGLYPFKADQYKYHLTIASIGKGFNFFTTIVLDFNSSGKSSGKT
jgi:hypothetical protein